MSIKNISATQGMILLIAVQLSAYGSVESLNAEDKKAVNNLSKKILISNAAERKIILKQIEVDQITLNGFQRELEGLPSNSISNNKVPFNSEAVWVELSLPADAVTKPGDINSRMDSRRRAREQAPVKAAEMATRLENKIPAKMKKLDSLRAKNNEERDAVRNIKMANLLKRIETDLKNANSSSNNNKVIDDQQDIRKRFEIQNKAQAKGDINNLPAPQPTLQLHLKYSAKEFEAMK